MVYQRPVAIFSESAVKEHPKEHPRDFNRPAAEYEHYTILGYRDHFCELITSAPVGKVYIELADQRRFLLSELPEEVVAELINESPLKQRSSCFYSNRMEFGTGPSFEYMDGKLILASIRDSSETPLRISPHKDGPYVAFPFNRKTLLEVFGEPNSWRKHEPPRPPW